ncbi:tRNA lysidine(34) synthetase TilS [Piscinibacter sp. Jin2]|uniref:tRNA(Ile)-lysidine synthase n=1 Tax=Aquariibacter lacus TaxID=2801332 RepID=A0A9X1BNN7_9BURK|nr:tRNA lysidine(34) synthetase TilS [Piscinibacter lacus]MBL0720227.1 tRNA lysidine(34) synthetase TilS [Piscinibacter lacus]
MPAADPVDPGPVPDADGPPAGPPGFAVAWSGGRDSTALLHASLRVARGLGLRVHAFHIDHGLQAASADWARRCAAQAARWARAGAPLRFASRRLEGRPGPGDSVEAWAREGRRAALAALAREAGVDLLLLAHHAGDQAETVLLQALRGAGPAGLAAMPARQWRQGLCWARPWREQPRRAIEAYLRRHRLRWIEDPSNAEPVHARNRLRQHVWPALDSAFPQAGSALLRLARHAAEAAENLRALAESDLALLGPAATQALPLVPVLDHPPARARLLLRHWIERQSGHPVPADRFESLWLALTAGRGPAAWPWPGGQLRRYRGLLRWGATAEGCVPDAPPAGLRAEPLPIDSPEPGLPPDWLPRLEARARQGGERFQAGPGRPPRALKKQFQAAGLPAWARQAPLFFLGETLVFVPGLGLDARCALGPGQPRLRLVWQPEGGRPAAGGLA